MSNRNISENLEYFIDNEGVHYDGPILDITTTGNSTISGNYALTGTWTLGGTALTTGTVTGSDNINIGAAPGRIIEAYYPRSQMYTITGVNLVANTELSLDWTAKAAGIGSFSTAPTPGAVGTFVQNVGGAPTHWEFPTKGHWMWAIHAFNFTLGDNQIIKLIHEYSANSGAGFGFIGNQLIEKAGAGTPAVQIIGGMNYWLFDPTLATGVERMRFRMTCTENKTVDVRIHWIFLNP